MPRQPGGDSTQQLTISLRLDPTPPVTSGHGGRPLEITAYLSKNHNWRRNILYAQALKG